MGTPAEATAMPSEIHHGKSQTLSTGTLVVPRSYIWRDPARPRWMPGEDTKESTGDPAGPHMKSRGMPYDAAVGSHGIT